MKAKQIAEGAVLAALSIVLSLASAYIPFLSFVTGLLAPLPLLVLVVRQGLPTGLVASFVLAFVLAMVSGPISGILVAFSVAVVGLWFGFGIRRGLRPLFILGIGVAVSAITVVLSLAFSVLVGGIPIAEMFESLRGMLDEFVMAYEKAGLLDALIGSMTVEAFKEMMFNSIKIILPAGLIISSMLVSAATYGLSALLLRRLGHKVNALPQFRRWHMHWVYLWGLIIALLCFLAGRFLEQAVFTNIAINILYIYAPILFLMGLSMIVYFWKLQPNMSLWKIVLIFSCVIMPPAALYFFIMTGLFDSVFDVRKRLDEALKNMQQKK